MKKSTPQKQAPKGFTPTLQRSPLRGISNLFFRDKPLFAIDIGATSVKVVQVSHQAKPCAIAGYGVSDFDTASMADGVITQPEILAATIRELLSKNLSGSITTRRVGFTIPATRCFIRSMSVPAAATKNLTEAVQLEVEQYIPMPLKELYLDHEVIRTTPENIELLVVAVPKKIVDSYLALAKILDLEVVAIEPTITANARLFARLEPTNVPTILIDFGSISSDVMVYDQTLLTASTVAGGGDTYTSTMAKQFNITHREAHFLKTKYGLNKSLTQQDVRGALAPLLEQLVTEIKRILRYYGEHVNNTRQIQQLVIMGGGSNMPGLTEYLTDNLRIPARQFVPWEKIAFHDSGKDTGDRYLYVTATGLALLESKELFK
ncbi:MAG TPA: type IV pilus assembly protein PilM [Patescibacteria group bacterium]|nr:type IV pilus assembly protein PilM [Patescibacteria group bacterium]